MTWGNILTSVGIAVSIIGLICEHVWTRLQLKKSKERDDFYDLVEMPLEKELARLGDFEDNVLDWERGHGDWTTAGVESSGRRVGRKFNQTINKVFRSRFLDQADRLTLKTDEFDESLLKISDDRKKHAKEICNAIVKLKRQINSVIKDYQIK